MSFILTGLPIINLLLEEEVLSIRFDPEAITFIREHTEVSLSVTEIGHLAEEFHIIYKRLQQFYDDPNRFTTGPEYDY